MSKTPYRARSSDKDSAEGRHDFAPGSPKTEETPSCEDYSFSPTASNRDEHSYRADTTSSAGSLDQNLYGDCDSFNKNLEYLKNKLRQLSLRGFSDNSEENFSGDETDAEMQPTRDNSVGHRPVRETFINLTDPSTVMCRRSFEVHSIPTTIYEVSEVVSTGSEGYSVPTKKQCCWEETPTFISECTSATSRSNLSGDASINYVVPTKKRCIMETPRFGCCITENYKRDVWTQCDDVAVDSSERKRKSARFSSVSDFTPRTDQAELRLYLPSSTMSDATVSHITEPKIQTINTTTKKQSKFRARNNKIAPSETESSTERLHSSGDQTFREKKYYLYKRYYEDSSEISCKNSTPGAIVSSIDSDIISTGERQGQSSRGFNSISTPSSGLFKSTSKVFDPVLSSSLDVPRKWIHNYDFPAFTKFAVYPLSVDVEKYGGNSSEECYRSIASTLLGSPTLSPASKKKSHQPSKKTCEKNSHRLCRKQQSTDMGFYAVSDTNLEMDSEINLRKSDDSRPTTTFVEEHACTNCFCFSVFFSKKKKKRFFT